MAFETLTEKLQSTFKKLTGRGKLNERDVTEAMREVRLALLEADVSLKVVKSFVEQVTARAAGEYFTRRQLPLVQAAGFQIVEADRSKAGTVERVYATKPGQPQASQS